MATSFRLAVLASLALTATSVFASPDTYTVSATLLHNGEPFGEPSAVVKADTPASIEVSGADGYKFSFTVTDLAPEKLQVSAKLESARGDIEPVVTVRPAEPATVTVGELGVRLTVVRGGT